MTVQAQAAQRHTPDQGNGGPGSHATPGTPAETDEQGIGLTVTHRRYVPYSHAHYGGDLVDGAYVLGLFGDVATELCIHTDADEGLFASYSDVQFRAPVRAGDVVEVRATLARRGTRSRGIELEGGSCAVRVPTVAPHPPSSLRSPSWP